MASIICMAVWSTEKNGRLKYTRECLFSLLDTVNFNKHRLFISDNKSSDETHNMYKEFVSAWNDKLFPPEHLIINFNAENLGTAEAVNLGIKVRKKGEYPIKMDDDIVFHAAGWVEEMEEAIVRYPKIGICGGKRNDLLESPNNKEGWYKSKLVMLPHESGQTWIPFEIADHVIGSVTMYNPELVDEIGYLKQFSVYSYDDVTFCARTWNTNKFICGFLPYLRLSHIDTGENVSHLEWKRDLANKDWAAVQEVLQGYKNKSIPLYYNPYDIQE